MVSDVTPIKSNYICSDSTHKVMFCGAGGENFNISGEEGETHFNP